MNTVSIRGMSPEDIPILVDWVTNTALWQRYQLTPAMTSAQFQEALTQSDILLVADLGPEDRACGFTWCLRHGGFGLSAYLRLIGVRQDVTNAGIGTALLVETERIAAETSESIFLLVSDFNEAAQRFYQQHGYRQIGTIPGYVLPDVSELIFWKQFDPKSENAEHDTD